MPQYRLFYLDHFQLTGSETIAADDDLDATLRGLRRAGGREVEIWRGACKLKAFPAAAQSGERIGQPVRQQAPPLPATRLARAGPHVAAR